MLGLAIILALLLDQSRGLFMKVCRTSFLYALRDPDGHRRAYLGLPVLANLSPFNQILGALHWGRIDFLSANLVLFSIANIVTWTWTGV